MHEDMSSDNCDQIVTIRFNGKYMCDVTDKTIQQNKNTKYAPVVAFAYNRADKIIGCLKSLEQNPESRQTQLYIYCDGAKSEKGISKVQETRKALHRYKEKANFADITIIEAAQNKGLARSIIEGVTEVINKHKKAIIVEDDLVVSERFLEFMNGALDYYKDNNKIGAISAYTYPLEALQAYDKDVYTMHKGDCWGWATWADRWNNAVWAEVDFNEYFKDKKLRRRFENTENGWDLLMLLQSQGKISSWAVRWVLNLLKENLLTVYPANSYVTNAGFDGSGTHSNKSEEDHYFTALTNKEGSIVFENLEPDMLIEKQAAVFPRKGLKACVKYFLKRCYVLLFDIKRSITK